MPSRFGRPEPPRSPPDERFDLRAFVGRGDVRWTVRVALGVERLTGATARAGTGVEIVEAAGGGTGVRLVDDAGGGTGVPAMRVEGREAGRETVRGAARKDGGGGGGGTREALYTAVPRLRGVRATGRTGVVRGALRTVRETVGAGSFKTDSGGGGGGGGV